MGDDASHICLGTHLASAPASPPPVAALPVMTPPLVPPRTESEAGDRAEWWLPPTPLKLCYLADVLKRYHWVLRGCRFLPTQPSASLFYFFSQLSLKTRLWLGFGTESMSLKSSSSHLLGYLHRQPSFSPKRKISCIILSVSSAHTNRLLEAGSQRCPFLSSILAGTHELIDK